MTEKKKRRIICTNPECGHVWQTVKKYTAFCAKCGFVTELTRTPEEEAWLEDFISHVNCKCDEYNLCQTCKNFVSKANKGIDNDK